MEKNKIIHLEKSNTLSNFLPEEERGDIVSLKITGLIGRKDFDDVLDDMCDSCGQYDADDNYTPDYELSAALRHLDLGEATYVDGDDLPYFGYNALLETFILPKGVKNTIDEGEPETGCSDSETLKTLVLPDGLKTVGGFNSCPNLTGVTLPEGLEEIQGYAFCGCKGITSIHIPASVRILDGSSFADCHIRSYEVDKDNPYFTEIDGVVYSRDLTTLVAFPSSYQNKHFTVPETTKTIGYSAFMYSHLESIDMPDGLVSIEESAFQGSTIKRIDMPDTITHVGQLAFRFCEELEYLRLSKGLKKIPSQVFTSCGKLKELDIPSNIKSVSYSNLAWCDGLEHLYLHNGLEEIADEGPMLGCGGNLSDVILPKTLKKVPGGMFNYTPNIKAFQLDPDSPYFSIIDGALCSKDGKMLFSVPDSSRTSYKVPEGIEVIAERVFAFLPKLKAVELPSTLQVIEDRAFQGCDSLCQIQIPSGVVKVAIDALWADNLKTVTMDSAAPPEMTGYVRDDDWRYRNVVLYVPRGVVSLYKNAPGWKCFNVKESKE